MPLPIESLHPRRSRGRINLPVKRISFRRPTRPPLSDLPIVPHLHPVQPPVVLQSGRVIAQYPVGLGCLAEFGGLDIAAVMAIGVQRQGDLAVGALDVGGGGGAGKAEEAVEVHGELGVERGGHDVVIVRRRSPPSERK